MHEHTRRYSVVIFQWHFAVSAFVLLPDHFLTALQRMGHMRRHSAAGSQHSSHQEVMNEMVDMGELEETERQAARPFWMRVRFYQILIPLLVSAILILVGVLLAAYQPVSVSYLAAHLDSRFDNCKDATGSPACSCTFCSCCCP